mmetsp:Transcript_15004/g.28389  ORF Transcript_15004/g.28389 Transcript_15004/m.28389 type:complete len:210 (+) Transcript_15004:292-921(+)
MSSGNLRNTSSRVKLSSGSSGVHSTSAASRFSSMLALALVMASADRISSSPRIVGRFGASRKATITVTIMYEGLLAPTRFNLPVFSSSNFARSLSSAWLKADSTSLDFPSIPFWNVSLRPATQSSSLRRRANVVSCTRFCSFIFFFKKKTSIQHIRVVFFFGNNLSFFLYIICLFILFIPNICSVLETLIRSPSSLHVSAPAARLLRRP